MDISLQYKILNDELLHKYLRENSYWYKILNRDSSKIDEMINEMKDKYKLNTSDKLQKISERLEMIESLLQVLE